jgi:hypothetical protein
VHHVAETKDLVAAVGIGLMAVLGLGLYGRVDAQEVTSRVRSTRGGILATAEGHQFEVFFYPTGVRVFLLDESGRPVDALGLTGHATFYHPNAPDSPWFSRPLHPDQTAPDHLPASLDLSIGLASAPRNGATVVFEIVGLQSKTSSTAEFKVPLEFVATTPARPAGSFVSRSLERIPTESLAVPASPSLVETGPATVAQPAILPLTYPLGTPGGVVTGADIGGSFIDLHRDWTTGRINLPLSKPWLQPRE